MREITGREARVEIGAHRGRLARGGLRPRRLPQCRVLAAGKGGVLARADVAQVAHDVHDFVVAEHDVHRAAGRARLALEPHQQVEHLARIRAAVDEVAEAHELRIAACPAQFAVHDTLRAQERRERVKGAVHVRESHDAAGAFDAIRGIVAGRAAGRGHDGDGKPEGSDDPGEACAHGAYHARVTAGRASG